MTWKIRRRSRKFRRCSGCGESIPVGSYYWEHVASPYDADVGTQSWWRLAECGACAERYGRPIEGWISA